MMGGHSIWPRGGDRLRNLHRYVYRDRAIHGLMQIVETPYGGQCKLRRHPTGVNANCGDGFGLNCMIKPYPVGNIK
jgi:hypothetical protein